MAEQIEESHAAAKCHAFGHEVESGQPTKSVAQSLGVGLSTGETYSTIVVNQDVLSELNRYLGTPEGRSFVQQTIERKRAFDPAVIAALSRYGVPAALDAIPFVESGYRNLPQNPAKPNWGAGLWMFIQSTAVNFGLRVDADGDQRLDVNLATDAAMRLLLANWARFGSWELSLLAYNVGEEAVQQAIEQTGSRNVWTLIDAGAVNDHNYVAKVMAAALILANPAQIE